MHKPNFGLVIMMIAVLFGGQLAAACACVMQPGHAPVAAHEASHQNLDREGHAASDHCVEPCVVTAGAKPTFKQVKGTLQTFEFADDAASSAHARALVDRDSQRGAALHAAYEFPPPLPDTLVRLHALLLT